MILAFSRRVKDMDYTALWYAEKLKALGILTDELESILAKYQPDTEADLKKTLNRARDLILTPDEEKYQAGAKAGILRSAPPMAESVALRQIIDTNYSLVLAALIRAGETAVNTTVAAMEDAFLLASTEAATGYFTLQQSVQNALDELAQKGITGFVSRNGRNYELAPYVRSEVFTRVMKTTRELGFERAREYGSDLIIISAHAGARPKCFPFQARIYSLSGTHPKYPPFSSTSYGEIDGLFGRNCRHWFDSWIEGIDREPTKEEQDPAKYELGKSNEQVYAEEQNQRYLEGKVREWKREEQSMNEEGVNSKKARDRVRYWQGRLREFTGKTGRTRHYDREKAA